MKSVSDTLGSEIDRAKLYAEVREQFSSLEKIKPYILMWGRLYSSQVSATKKIREIEKEGFDSEHVAILLVLPSTSDEWFANVYLHYGELVMKSRYFFGEPKQIVPVKE